MKLTKSILRPVRATRKGCAASLSFLTRRFCTNSCFKGGRASHFFTISRKKRGGSSENHEPSSPKVTCIGQVRVKSKKKAKQCRRQIGEVSFRKTEQSHGGGRQIEDKDKVWIRPQRFSSSSSHSHRDQRRVYLPISVCEALRAFKAEVCCFFPCKCSCFSRSKREKTVKSGCYADEDGCGAVFARWLVSVNGGEGGKKREIEVVVGGEDEDREEMMSFRSSRRHVFDDIEVEDDRIEVKRRSFVEEEEEARVSICMPPKNALLLMRCRSDPTRMAALCNRFSLDGSHSAPEYENRDVHEESNGNVTAEHKQVRGVFEGKNKIFVGQGFERDDEVASAKLNAKEEIGNEDEASLEMEVGNHGDVEEHRGEELVIGSEERKQEIDENKESLVEEEEEEEEEVEKTEHLSEFAQSNERKELTSLTEKVAIEKEKQEKTEESADIQTVQENEAEGKKQIQSTEVKSKIEELVINNQETKKEKESSALPECLLLMMCEPKLSMEVSKETWIRGTDFVKMLPERPRKAARATTTTTTCGGGDHEPVKRRPSIEYKSKPRVPAPASKKSDHQPPRSSCSLPAASVASTNEPKQGNGGKYEPLVLTRCKSEPMSTAAAKLMPESCNASMKLEPHRRAAVGVGAAGVS